MKILIIGSKGFIGQHLLSYYLKLGVDVYGADIVVDYVEKRYFLIDSSNSEFQSIFNKNKFDFCINCSGAASVPDSLLNPVRDFNLNTYNIFRLADAIRTHNPTCKLINLSSAAVYGNPISIPIDEKQQLMPLSPYGFHKKLSEDILFEYYSIFGVQNVSLRIFSAYGPGLKKQLLWDIVQKSLKNNKIVLYGTGDETRDYIHVNDIVNCIEIIRRNGNFNSTSYNVANGTQITTKEIATELLDQLSFNGSLEFTKTNRPGDPLKWQADISKIIQIGYKQSISLKEGLINYTKWVKELK